MAALSYYFLLSLIVAVSFSNLHAVEAARSLLQTVPMPNLRCLSHTAHSAKPSLGHITTFACHSIAYTANCSISAKTHIATNANHYSVIAYGAKGDSPTAACHHAHHRAYNSFPFTTSCRKQSMN
ncbi:UNVERIFIED_CONTAM: hypothetical protein Sradi_5620500 [Sesamum radiatum]|uniref:Uncharacterized protein n=1 Tax=Sesamum radiatum TaxID=300843 RepID=A0AAW2KZ11_SESRA